MPMAWDPKDGGNSACQMMRKENNQLLLYNTFKIWYYWDISTHEDVI